MHTQSHFLNLNPLVILHVLWQTIFIEPAAANYCFSLRFKASALRWVLRKCRSLGLHLILETTTRTAVREQTGQSCLAVKRWCHLREFVFHSRYTCLIFTYILYLMKGLEIGLISVELWKEEWRNQSFTPWLLFEMETTFSWGWKREGLELVGGTVLAGKWTQTKQFCKLLKGKAANRFQPSVFFLR